MINLALNEATAHGAITSSVPLSDCGAMSQGYIGFRLEAALRGEYAACGIAKEVATVVTQVLRDADDASYGEPTKPIGRFYTADEAAAVARAEGFVMKEDAGRGFRRVVASPRPLDVVEKNVIKLLAAQGCTVIAAGGGGVPVTADSGRFSGAAAVIDKDFAAEKLAELIGADMLLILTAIDKVYINYRKPDQQALETLTAAEAQKYIEDGQFAAGSMLPKVQACAEFAAQGGTAIIAALSQAQQIFAPGTGTVIRG